MDFSSSVGGSNLSFVVEEKTSLEENLHMLLKKPPCRGEENCFFVVGKTSL